MAHDCRHLLGDLSAYLDGDAAPVVCAEIERHLRDCADCRVVIDTLRKTVTLYRTQPASRLPDDARDRLYAALNLNEYKPRSR
ncbi:MAG: zf-HC2 domain-containing protein [Chloroflexi bacterium]|nr:zf-HC2 domain-containing protein [Chloroflexota bacterium]